MYRFYEAIMHNGEAIKALINGVCLGGEPLACYVLAPLFQ